MYTDKVQELANIPENHAIMFGLSFGYADEANPINQFEVGRANVDDLVEFISEA